MSGLPQLRGSLGSHFLQRRHRGPVKLREQPGGGLLDKLVFGVGVGHGTIAVEANNSYGAVNVANQVCAFSG